MIMAGLIFAFLGTLQLQTYNIDGEFYLLFGSSKDSVSFSSFRLSNPERIVLEVTDEEIAGDKVLSGATVEKVEIKNLPGKTRLIFYIKAGSAYNILNKKNLLLIGFREDVFTEEGSLDTVLASVKSRLPEKQPVAVAAVEPVKDKTVIKEVVKEKEPDKEDRLIAEMMSQKKAEEDKRLAELESKRLLEEKRIAEEKRISEERRIAEAEAKKAEQKRLAELESKRLAEEKRLSEEKRIAEAESRKAEEKKRLAELENKRLAEEKRLAELENKRLAEEKQRIAVAEERKLAEEKKLPEEKKLADAKEIPANPEIAPEVEISQATNSGVDFVGKKNLKVVKAKKTKKISEEAPELPIVKLAEKGQLKNIYFRKYQDFSRVTMEITGDIEYRFREIKGGYVIDIFNLSKIPRHLLNLIDARAFNAQVQYIYPKKVDNIFKIYIKADQNIAVRKSEDGKFINFDFYMPTVE